MVAFTPINTGSLEQPCLKSGTSTLTASTRASNEFLPCHSTASSGSYLSKLREATAMDIDTRARKRKRSSKAHRNPKNALNHEGEAGEDVIVNIYESNSLETPANSNEMSTSMMKSRGNERDTSSIPPSEPLFTSAITFSAPTSIDAIRASGGTCVTLYQSAENQATAPNSSMPWTRSNASQNRIPLFGDSQEQSKMGDLPIYQKHDKSDTAQTSGEEATETHPSAQSEVTLCAREGEDLVCATDDETRETLEPTIRRFPSQVSTSRDRRMNIREVDEHDDYGGKKQLQSMMPNQPVARKPFPAPVLAHSLILGLSNSIVLKTCFRLGEALNAGCSATRRNENVILEIYARVVASWRDGPPWQKQHFVLRDLYHDNPPHLLGVYRHWNQSRLWAADSEIFLDAQGPGIKARIIGIMKREGLSWSLQILNIWQASWEDIDTVADIYCS